MRAPEPAVAEAATTPVPVPSSPYWDFYEQVAGAQLAAWLPAEPLRVLDLAGDRAEQLRALGHDVVRVGAEPLSGVATVQADGRDLSWLASGCLDAVVAETRCLSQALATEETVRDLVRVLRPGGRLLLVVDSLHTGLARLAGQGRWAELADVPAADVVLVPEEDGSITRCFWPGELAELLADAGLVVDWVRPRTVLTAAAVERTLAEGGPDAMAALVRTELDLAAGHDGEAAGMSLVASARLG